METLTHQDSDNVVPTSVWLFSGGWLLVVGGFAVLQVWSLTAYAFDLGFMVHALAAIARGGFDAPASWAGWSFLEDHFSPLALPLTLMAGTPFGGYYLVFVQAFAVAASIVLAWRLIALRVTTRLDRWLLLIAYSLAPALMFAVLFDFHPSVLGIPFLILALRGHIASDEVGFTIGCLGLSLAREDMAILAILMWLVLSRSHRWPILIPLVSGTCLLAWTMLRGGPQFSSRLWFSYLLATPISDLPAAVLSATLNGTLLPLLAIGLLLPWLILRVDWRYLLLISAMTLPFVIADNPLPKSLGFHYFAAVPALFLAGAIAAWGEKTLSSPRRTVVIGLMTALAIAGPIGTARLAGPGARSLPGLLALIPSRQADAREIRNVVHCLPRDRQASIDQVISPLMGDFPDIRIWPNPFRPYALAVGDVVLDLVPASTDQPEFLVILVNSDQDVPDGYFRSNSSSFLYGRGGVPDSVDGCIAGIFVA